MAKRKPGVGHNSEPLDDDEVAALEAYYAQKIRAAQRKADEAKAAYDCEREEVNGLFAQVKADLKTSRKEFQDLIEKQSMSEAEFAAYWRKLTSRYQRGGLPVGAQLDMFAVKDTADEKAVAYADGERAGLAGIDPTPPSYIAAVVVSDWMSGWHAGQKVLYMRLAKAEEIIASRGEPDAPEGDDVDLNDDEEELTEAAIKAGVKNLKNSGFLETADA